MEEGNHRYYCYVCQKYFSSTVEAYACLLCDSQAIEQAQAETEEGSLERFEVFELTNQRQETQVLGTLDNIVYPQRQRMPQNILSVVQTTIRNVLDFAEGSYLGNLMSQLLRDGNRLTAATQEQINKLQKLSHVKECSICQSFEEGEESKEEKKNENEESQGFRLKCNHTFHQSCIRPWFERANTCPVCRTEIH